MRILALDIGSSSVKAGLYSGKSVVARGRVGYVTHFDGRRVEIVPRDVLKAVMEAGRAVLGGGKDRGRSPDAIAFCAFSPGVVVADERGRARTNIITHADRRSTEVAAKLVARHGKSFWLRHAGNLPYPGSIGASTLAFLRKDSPGIFKGRGGVRIGQATSLIGWALTHGGGVGGGEWVIDPSQAMFMGLYDIRTGAWNEALCAAVGVRREMLPRIVPADSVVGKLGAQAARQLGLAAGIPIVGGFVDTSAAVIQTPMAAGQLAHNAGSTDVLAMCLDEPQPAEGILTRPVGTGAGGSFGMRWLGVRTIASNGSALQWMRDTMFRELGEAAWRQVVKSCAAERKGNDEAADLPECLPTFAGERAAIAQPAGATMSKLRLGTTREEILRGVILGLVKASAENYRRLAELHKPARVVYATGGAGSVGDAMHRAWAARGGKHVFEKLPSDNLAGLVMLAKKVLG